MRCDAAEREAVGVLCDLSMVVGLFPKVSRAKAELLYYASN